MYFSPSRIFAFNHFSFLCAVSVFPAGSQKGRCRIKEYLKKLHLLSIPVMFVIFSLSCNQDTATTLTPPPLQSKGDFSEIQTGLTADTTDEEGYPVLPPLITDPEKMVPLPEGYTYGENLIYARDYMVDSYTDEMRGNGFLLNSDGTLYFFPTEEEGWCGYYTILFDIGGVGI